MIAKKTRSNHDILSNGILQNSDLLAKEKSFYLKNITLDLDWMIPVNMGCLPNVESMLGQRRRQLTSINPTLV